MRYLVVGVLLFFTHFVFAGPIAGEKPISEARKARITQKLEVALAKKDITKKQYDESIGWLHATPCAGVDRGLTDARRRELASAIKRQEKSENVDILGSFAFEEWHIVYIDDGLSDPPYLFYSGNPTIVKRAITAWSGTAFIFETTEVRDWVLKNAPGISDHLASCFAWHVTLNRN